MTDFGTVSVTGSGAAVRFERWYAAPAAELWDALTAPERMARWLGAEVHIQAQVGGAVALRWAGGEQMDGVITVFEPGRVLACTWREAALGVESVRPRNDRVRLLAWIPEDRTSVRESRSRLLDRGTQPCWPPP